MLTLEVRSKPKMRKQKFICAKLLIITIVIILWSEVIYCYSNNPEISTNSVKEIYSLVRIPNPSIEKMKSLNIDKLIFRRSYYKTEEGAEIVLDQSEIEILKTNGIDFVMLVKNVTEFYVERNKQFTKEYLETLRDSLQHFEYGSMGGFYTFAEAVAELDSMKLFYPDIISVKDSIGSTHFDNPIWMVKISDNPNIDEDEPELLYTSLHHANEPQGLMSLIYYMWYLLENYGIDEEVTYLVNNREMYFMPVLNVDGYMYNQLSHPSGSGMWRKNGRNNGDGTYGVDLNRNYGYMWGYDDIGSSPETGSDFYRGPEPFSEPEVQAIRDFILERELKIDLNFHTYGNIVVLPFGYSGGHTPDVEIYESYGANVSAQNNYNYGTPFFAMGFPANGCCEDWMYGEQTVKDKVFGFAVEVGNAYDSYWPPIDRIYPLAQENVYSCLLASKYSGAFMELEDYYVAENDYLISGANNDLIVVLKNIGLSDGTEDFSVVLSCDDTEITVSNDSLNFPGINSQQEIDNSSNPFQVYIPPDIPVGYYVSFNIKIKQDSLNFIEKSFPLIVGMTIENSVPVEWIDIALHQMLGWDYQCGLETRFEGYGKFLEVIESEDGLIYRYFLTGKFYLQSYPEPFEYLYRLWAFLDLNSNGEIPYTLDFPSYVPYDSLVSFHMLEGHGEGYPVRSGSAWYDGEYTTIDQPELLYSVYASGDVLEYEGVAYEGFEIEGKHYYLTEGTLYDVAGDSLMSPRSIMGTLKYDSGEYQINLESGIWEDYYHNFIGEYYDDMRFTNVEVTTFELEPPQNVTIIVNETELTIQWSPVTGANSYKIYSDSNPYGTFTTLEQEGIGETNWTTSISGNSKFYRVIASTSQPIRIKEQK